MVRQSVVGQGPMLFPRKRRHPRLFSWTLVSILWLLSLPPISSWHGPDQVGVPLLAAAVVIPLFWRREAPFLVFCLSACAATLQWAAGGVLFADLALLVAFYTVAATQVRRRTLTAAGVLEVFAVIAAARYGAGGGNGSGYVFVFVLVTGLVVASGLLGLNVKVRAAYLAEVEARADRAERERDQQSLLAAAAERTRIAREMHDIVAHNLSVMIALNDGASFAMHTEPDQAADAVREASRVGRTALSELQRALGVLRERPDGAGGVRTPAPTIAELEALLVPIRRTGLAVTLRIEGETDQLAPGLQLTVYRLVQESLTNTVKHAIGADHASVSIRCAATAVEVVIADNGHARGAPSAAGGSGHGIIGMHERAAGHGGQVAAGPTPNGWLVRAYFPLQPADMTQQLPATIGAAS